MATLLADREQAERRRVGQLERDRAFGDAAEEDAALAVREDLEARSYGLSASSANELAECRHVREEVRMGAEPDPYDLEPAGWV